MNAPFEPSPPTIDELMAAALGLSKSNTPPEIGAILKQAAALDPTPLEIDALLKLIKKKTSASLNSLRDELKMHREKLKLSVAELAQELAQTVLDEEFAEGTRLKRGTDGSYWVHRKTHWAETSRGNIRSIVFRRANQPPFPGLFDKVGPVVNATTQLIDLMVEPIADPVGFMGEPAPVINCRNVEVWIGEDGEPELHPHSPHSLQTACLPIEYDPNAQCPLYDKAVAEIFSVSSDTAGMVRHFHEFAGYAIQPGRDIACFWLLIGNGANGKSKLLGTIANCLGHEAISYRSFKGMKGDNFAIASLAGKLLMIEDDLTENTRLPDGLIKQISERKPMTARHPYGRRAFTYICRALPVMVGNSYPRTVDVSFGLIRRAQVIPFEKRFEGAEDNPKLFPKIWETEMPGVLNRFLEGLTRLRTRGAFDPPQDCQEAFVDFMAHANPLVGFVDECCILDPKGRIRLDAFWALLTAWCKDQGYKIPFGRKQLRRKLLGLNCTIKKVKGYQTLYGFSLGTQPDDC